MRVTSADSATPSTFSQPSRFNFQNTLPQFTSDKFATECENEYSRYLPNSSVVAHALVLDSHHGDIRAIQFLLPDQQYHHAYTPMVGHLTAIERFPLPDNHSTIAGMVGDTPMISRRCYEINIAREDAEPETYCFYPLSPTKNSKTQQDRPIFYDTSEMPIFQDTPQAQELVASIPVKIKTSDALLINNAHVKERIKISTRQPDQNTVMGRHHHKKAHSRENSNRRKAKMAARNEKFHVSDKPTPRSAVTEMEEFLHEYDEFLTAEAYDRIHQSAIAPLKTIKPEGQNRAEWLHRHSHNLHPLDIDPQREDNLGAAEKRYNTQMMIIERATQFFALHVARSENRIHDEFAMLLDSEIIRKIRFNAFIQCAGVKIKLTQHILCFQREPQDVKASDLASLIGMLHALVLNVPPRSIQAVQQSRFDANIIPFRGNFFQLARTSTNRVQIVDDDDMTLLTK